MGVCDRTGSHVAYHAPPLAPAPAEEPPPERPGSAPSTSERAGRSAPLSLVVTTWLRGVPAWRDRPPRVGRGLDRTVRTRRDRRRSHDRRHDDADDVALDGLPLPRPHHVPLRARG